MVLGAVVLPLPHIPTAATFGAAAVATRPVFEDIASNHHVLQVVQNPDAGYTSRADHVFGRVLAPDAPIASYRRRKDETKTGVRSFRLPSFASSVVSATWNTWEHVTTP